MGSVWELKKRVYEANIALPRHGLVKFTFGNASGIDRESGLIAIKPSGVPYGELTPDSMTLVDLDGAIVEKGLRPSSDTPTHLVLYNRMPDIDGIVHTHSTYATAWAQALHSIPCLGTTHADHAPNDILCTRQLHDDEIGGDYERETGNVIMETLGGGQPLRTAMILVASHGPFTWGASPEDAVYAAVVLEELARMAYLTFAINPTATSISRALHDRHYSRKHGTNAYYGQDG